MSEPVYVQQEGIGWQTRVRHPSSENEVIETKWRNLDKRPSTPEEIELWMRLQRSEARRTRTIIGAHHCHANHKSMREIERERTIRAFWRWYKSLPWWAQMVVKRFNPPYIKVDR